MDSSNKQIAEFIGFSSKDNLRKGNLLIAKFMGYDVSKIVDEMPVNKYGEYCNGNGDMDKDGNPCYLTYFPSLQYDTSYDQLMAVVKKIMRTEIGKFGYGFSFHINNDACWFGIDNRKHEGLNMHMNRELNQSIWCAVVETIQWIEINLN